MEIYPPSCCTQKKVEQRGEISSTLSDKEMEMEGHLPSGSPEPERERRRKQRRKKQKCPVLAEAVKIREK